MTTKLRNILNGRIGIREIRALGQSENREELFHELFDEDKRTSDNAAWAMTHLPEEDNTWLTTKQTELIDEAMRTESISKRRLILTALLRTEFKADDIRTDFLDFCLDLMMHPDQPNGVRTVAMKLAFAQSIPFPELLGELRQTLDIMDTEFLSPALRTTKKNLLKNMNNKP